MRSLEKGRGRQAGKGRKDRVAVNATVLGVAYVLAATASLPAMAQQAGNTVQLDTINVAGAPQQQKQRLSADPNHVDGYVATRSASGSKTNTPLNETPQAIAVVGAEQIRDQAATTVDQATRYSPGIHSQSFGADPRNDWFLIRGFNEQTTGYYLDGLQLFSTAFATFKLDPFNLERIDILRGPSAALYGGGDPGGLINAVSKMPTFTTFGEVVAGVNSFGNASAGADIGGVAGDKQQWAYRLVTIGHAGGTQTDHTDDDRGFVAPSLTYRPDATTSLTLLGQYQHDYTNGENFLPYQGTVTAAPYGRISTSLFTSDPSIDKFQRDQAMAGYRFETAINPNVILRQNVRYDFLSVNEQTLYGVGYDTAVPLTATNAQLERFNFVTRPTVNAVTTDNQAEFHFDTGPLQHVALAGVDYKYYQLRDTQGFALGSDLNLLNPTYTVQTVPTSRYETNTTIQNQVGLYGQDQIKFDRLTVVGAVREDFVDTRVNGRTNGIDSQADPTATTGKVGAIYNFDNGIAPYVSYATSFNPILGTNTASNTPYVPETGEQEEVGVKYQSPTLPISASLALFNLTRDNVLTTDPTNVLNSIQTGEQRSRGIEFNAAANLTDGLKVIGSFTAYDLSITKDLDPTLIGKAPTGTPQAFGSLWLDYTIQHGAYKGLGFGAGARYTGRSYADQLNTMQVPDFLLGDAAIHYERDNWRFALNVSNVADTVYVGSCSSTSACFYGDRRQFSFSAAYKW